MAVELLEGEGERNTQQAAVPEPDIAQYPRIAGSNPARPTSDEAPVGPGCLVCGETIPEGAAKKRSKVCSDACRYAYRKWRNMTPAERAAAPALRCQACRGEIPHKANVAWQETCSQNCRNAMRRYRFSVLQNQKCPHCYHPSTDEEREDYRAWRASRGPIQGFSKVAQGRGNFARQRERTLRDALEAAIGALAVQRDEFLAACAERNMEGLTEGEANLLRGQDEARLIVKNSLLDELRAAVEQSQVAVFSANTLEKLRKKRKGKE